jgi:hypothetical protein
VKQQEANATKRDELVQRELSLEDREWQAERDENEARQQYHRYKDGERENRQAEQVFKRATAGLNGISDRMEPFVEKMEQRNPHTPAGAKAQKSASAIRRDQGRAESVKASAIAEVENIKAKWRDPDWLADNWDKDDADQDDYQPGG